MLIGMAPMLGLIAEPPVRTLVNPTLTANVGDGADYNTRIRINAAAYTSGIASCSQIRVTLKPPTTGSNPVMSSVWVGHTVTANEDFDGSQVQLWFAGSASPALVSGGADVVSDWASFPFDPAKALVVSFGVTAHYGLANSGGATNYWGYYVGGGSASAGTTAVVPIGGGIANSVYHVSKIEVR